MGNQGSPATFNWARVKISARELNGDAHPRYHRDVGATTSSPDADAFRAFALAAAPQAAAVANYCDHAEHNEKVDAEWVVGAADALRGLALEFATQHRLDLFELYAARLRAVESANVFQRDGGFDGAAAVRAATTWRELQVVQAEHDRAYHLDVSGLSRAEQLRHYAFHLAKIVGAFAVATDEEELLERRLPDTLLFALKLRTVMAKRLPDDELPRLR